MAAEIFNEGSRSGDKKLIITACVSPHHAVSRPTSLLCTILDSVTVSEGFAVGLLRISHTELKRFKLKNLYFKELNYVLCGVREVLIMINSYKKYPII